MQTKNNFLQEALRYQSLGFSVFPVWKGTKNKPILPWKKYMTSRPSETEIRDWWTKYPEANIALVTGKISGIFALDTEKDFDLSNLKIPENTFTVKTGSGGRHFYFKLPQSLEVGTHVEIWGKDPKNKADIKAEGGYIVAPPSFNEEKGTFYEIISGKVEEITECPEWLLEEIGKREVERFSVPLSEIAEGSKLGNRNVSATSFIGHVLLKTDVSMWEIVAWPAILHWNAKNSPPLSDKELRGIFDSIARREFNRRNGVETKEDLKDYEGPDRVISSHEMRKTLSLDLSAATKYRSITLQSLDRYCDGFVPGELIVVSGPEKSGKTSFLQFLTTSFANQELACLWFTYEMTVREFISKFRELPIFYLPMLTKTYNLDWLEKRIIEAKMKYGVKFVFIDHLEFVVDVETVRNPAISLGFVVRRLKNIAREQELVIFVVHHIRRMEIGEVPSARLLRDSALVAAEADTTVMVWRIPKFSEKKTRRRSEEVEYENDAIIKICNHRRSGVIEKSFRVKYVGDKFLEVSQLSIPEESSTTDSKQGELFL